MKYKIITATDKAYFNFAKVLVKSATINFPESSMYIELINMDENAKAIIKKICPKCEVELKSVRFKYDAQKKCFCTNRRARLFEKLRNRCDDILIWVDADSIIRKPCDELKEIASKHDVSIATRFIKNKKRILAGVIAFNNTEKANKLLKRYITIMKKENKWQKVKDIDKLVNDGFTWKVWMSNQMVLNRLCMVTMKDEISFGELGNKHCDCYLTDDGVIWAAKNTHKKSQIYLKELKKYKV